MKSFSTLSLVALIFGLLTTCSSQEDRQSFFNQLAESPEWKPDSVIAVLEINKGWHIGDLGAGGGYYTYRFAEETGPTGQVFAADINKDFLAGIEDTAEEKGLNNVQIIYATADDSNFENQSLDLLFTRNTFHHINNKNQYMKKLANKIKADGKIALIDYKNDASASPIGHSSSREEILSSIEDTGLVIEKEYDFLEKQYFFMLKKQSGQ
jgi:ubiquinone/menaquinone biosynthesis C-methylase UbiE